MGVESLVVEEKVAAEKPVDRQKCCPLLLRVFYATNHHNNLSEYMRGNLPQNELQIYTWTDATLYELSSLIKEVNPDAKKKGTVFDFAIVYPDSRNPNYRMREIGMTCSGQKGLDDTKTLSQLRFSIGDYLDISITPPFAPWNPLLRQNNRRAGSRNRPY